MNKKRAIGIVGGMILLIIGIFYYRNNMDCELYPTPDKIIVFESGEVVEIKNDDDIFYKICNLHKMPKTMDVTETSISDDDITEIEKEGIAVEYIYYNDIELNFDVGEEKCRKILFVYSGWCRDNVIFGEENYQSGTVEQHLNQKKLEQLVKID